jgi:hypothetical protein
MTTAYLPCDGCGQPASPEHIARRLQRLEWTTRYRPVHIGTLLLAGISPQVEAEFLYAGKFAGEAARLLEAVAIDARGKTAEVALAEFQKGGYFLTHLLECPIESGTGNFSSELLVHRVTAVLAKIRRSLKPKRVALISEKLEPVMERLSSADLGCPLVLDGGRPFAFDGAGSASIMRLREALAGAAAVRRRGSQPQIGP